jgi:hypothetical protein
VIGTGVEVEAQTKTEVALDIAIEEGVTLVVATVAMIIMEGLPHAPPALGMIHLTIPLALPPNALHRVAHLALPLDSMDLNVQIIHDRHPLPTGTPIHLDL